MKPLVKYDPKVNILSIRFSNKKSVDSDVKENVVIDYDQKGEIVNLEIMKVNLSEFLKTDKSNNLIPDLTAG
ncbi:MAG: DUF2283 domain-containing protein [Candidatus Pacebacteria bacterium]|jgi:uncharacterized protein YuzE|nr:DUF2283 domain-containing protein [Candidatus Paceibacterota bacterium]